MITAIRGTGQTSARTSSREEVLPADAPLVSRALIAVTPVSRSDATLRPSSRRASASFLAQLIATEQMHPQTRVHNRAEPRDVIAAYGEVARMLRKLN